MSKNIVDDFKKGKRIPHCQLKAKISHHQTTDYVFPDLECDIDIIGAKQPHNTFCIDYCIPEGMYMARVIMMNIIVPIHAYFSGMLKCLLVLISAGSSIAGAYGSAPREPIIRLCPEQESYESKQIS